MPINSRVLIRACGEFSFWKENITESRGKYLDRILSPAYNYRG
jgi:hypothetical protein